MNRYFNQIKVCCFLPMLALFLSSCNGKNNIPDSNKNETQSTVPIVSETTTTARTVQTEPPFDYEAARKKYTDKCHIYNEAVMNYNQEISRNTALIDSLKAYNISIQYDLSYKNLMSSEIDDEILKDTDLEVFDTYVRDIESETENVRADYYDICCIGYEQIATDYNTLVDAYNSLINKTSIDFIDDVRDWNWVGKIGKTSYDLNVNTFTKQKYITDLEAVYKKIEKLAVQYKLVKQITAPNEKWISERLKKVQSITGQMAVTSKNDPNQMLGKQGGGYKNCIYFTVKDIDSNSVKGNTIVDKGTDAGGCIESYGTLEDALHRCDYLSQFDNTLLYSGSYVIVGTMVVRTSYKLTDQQQVDLTNEIINVFTVVE